VRSARAAKERNRGPLWGDDVEILHDITYSPKKDRTENYDYFDSILFFYFFGYNTQEITNDVYIYLYSEYRHSLEKLSPAKLTINDALTRGTFSQRWQQQSWIKLVWI